MNDKDDLLLRRARRFKYISLTIKASLSHFFLIKQEQEQGFAENFGNYHNNMLQIKKSLALSLIILSIFNNDKSLL